MVNTLGTLFPGIVYFQNKFISAAVVLLLTAIIAKLLLVIFEKVLQRFAKKTKTKLDDIIFEKTKKPLFYLIVVYGAKLVVRDLGWNGTLDNIISSLMALVFVYILGNVAHILLNAWLIPLAKATKTKLDEILLPILNKTINIIFIIVAFMWILQIWNIDITPYLAGVGISGLVLGMALQDSLKNVFGGISLLLDKTFRVGDKVKLESGEVGEIHSIGLRSTKLVTYDNEIIYIPNGQLANSRIQNYTRPTTQIRIKVPFGVEYGTDTSKVRSVVMGLLNSHKEILTDPEPSVQFLEMGDSSLNFQAAFWVDDWSNAYGLKIGVTEEIYNTLNKENIGIPFPTRTVYMKKE
ncbi:hypothetical protein CL619_00450 [archaeon]|nr:hypothetical protein [archaeon]